MKYPYAAYRYGGGRFICGMHCHQKCGHPLKTYHFNSMLSLREYQPSTYVFCQIGKTLFSSSVQNPRIQKLLDRYISLRPEDRMKLIQQHVESSNSYHESIEWRRFIKNGSNNDIEERKKLENQKRELKRRTFRLQQLQKPSYVRKRKPKIQRMQQTEQVDPPVTSENFLPSNKRYSMVEDRHKAEMYEEICRRLQKQWKTDDLESDRAFDIMVNALREELMDQSRPILVNELADYDNPYMMKRQALKILLQEECARNSLDESMVDEYLDQRSDLLKLRLQAKLPPEVLEPLHAFRGDVRYNFDARKRLSQKLDGVNKVLELLKTGDDKDILKLFSKLPENNGYSHPNHPFKNHFGFESAVPSGVAGSILMGRKQRPLEAQLSRLRYPTLQRVSHSLPKDPKYRAMVVHAIKVLERSKGWDFARKIKAVSTLIEVLNNMAPSDHYENVIDRAFPVIRGRGMTRRTKSRNQVFCKGLKYLRSLTTSKPLHLRLQKKKGT